MTPLVKTLDLIEQCREQARQRGAGTSCLQLFERAIEKDDQTAWAALDTQYRSLLCWWIHRQRPHQFNETEVDDLASDAFAKFWQSMRNYSETFADRFNTLPQVLQYLRLCVTTVLQDAARREQRLDMIDTAAQQDGAAFTPFADFDSAETQSSQLAQVTTWASEALKGEAEQVIFVQSFEYGLTPRQIADGWPTLFIDVAEVRKVKMRILRRAKRQLVN